MADLLASVDDLSGAPGLSLDLTTPQGQAQAAYMLRVATAQVVAEIGWSPFQSERVWVVSRRSRVVFLPAAHVTAVTVSTADGVLEGVTWDALGMVDFGRYVTGAEIRYTAGWPPSDMPDALVTACVDLAAGRLDNPSGIRSRSWATGSESESLTYATVGETSIQDGRLDAYRLPAAVA